MEILSGSISAKSENAILKVLTKYDHNSKFNLKSISKSAEINLPSIFVVFEKKTQKEKIGRINNYNGQNSINLISNNYV
jgi:hypothetical protein